MIELHADQIRFESSSVVDPVGKVFHFDNRVFRAISPAYAGFVKDTIELAGSQNLFDEGLVPTWPSDFTIKGSPLVIEHQRVPFVTLRGEWCGEALREAALCILKVSAALLKSNLCLKDAHPWNVLFDGSRPYFVDWGSIAPVKEINWSLWYKQFRQFLLAPLHAFSIGHAPIARAMLREHKVGVGNQIIEQPFLVNEPAEANAIAHAACEALTAQTFEALADYVANLVLPHVEGEWSAYAQPRLSSLVDMSSLREKDRIVHRILEDDQGRTLIDIGTNNGLHSELAASLGKRVLACDIEEACLNALYSRTRQSGADILPLFHDLLWPIGTSGIFNSIQGAEDRLSCDTAMVMAVTHHLAFKQRVSFEGMAGAIARLAKRRAIVEFVPADDEHVALWSPEQLPWYTLDNFIKALRLHFRTYSIVPSDPHPRCIILLEK
ncbi:hypothetical protein [Caballeronia sp. DA-9]|uniref:hypothetical protein n=1 Tax=Caballeronia sp. DA-9 TaxID=3436237 RepID=UPI003F66AFD9